jgi:hypothetical protein
MFVVMYSAAMRSARFGIPTARISSRISRAIRAGLDIA